MYAETIAKALGGAKRAQAGRRDAPRMMIVRRAFPSILARMAKFSFIVMRAARRSGSFKRSGKRGFGQKQRLTDPKEGPIGLQKLGQMPAKTSHAR